MNLLQMLVESRSGGVVDEVAGKFGLSQSQAKSVVENLVPVLARGVQNNASGGDGLAALLGALSGGGHARYLDDPASLGKAGAVAEGNAILGHVLGSKDVSRNVAARTAKQTGVSADVVKQMLPLVAAAVMGALSKQTQKGGGLSTGPDLGALAGFLDADKDGSVADDLLGLAKKFF